MDKNPSSPPWKKAARLRRIIVLAALIATTITAGAYMAQVLPKGGSSQLEKLIILVFAALFAWISIGFWEAMAGVLTVMRRRDPFAVDQDQEDDGSLPDPSHRTALLIPVHNEDSTRVFANLRAIYESLRTIGRLDHFDFFILSDTTNPEIWAAEEIGWAELCRSLGAADQIFYRRRSINLKRKSGNIGDFCRRWGGRYSYMVVLDADSIMTGSALSALVTIMDRNPTVGIVQTLPQAVNRESIIARSQQFAGHLYGPIFSAGLHFLELGDSHYWGHNAIIRVEPFMKHCALPRLPGKAPFGGDIMSHDFVEAALMRRAGWEVWLAYNLGGSYEEVPPTLLDELKRDRRWCQGNLQHLRLLFTKGLFSTHRALFLHGIFSYGSSLLWLIFLSLSTAEAVTEAFHKPDYFPDAYTLFPAWPVWHFHWALTLLAMTAVILFLPKLFSVLTVIRLGKTAQFGGIHRLFMSAAAEVITASLFAPIRMLFYSKFLVMTLLGLKTGWSPQERGDRGTSWGEAIRCHGTSMVVALLWASVLFLWNRSFFWWNAPVFIPLFFSVPLSVWSSRPGLGRLFRKLGIFLIAEEINTPVELRHAAQFYAAAKTNAHRFLPGPWKNGFIRAIADPRAAALRISFLRNKPAPHSSGRQKEVIHKALNRGPAALSEQEKKALLNDASAIRKLHLHIWETADETIAATWGIPCDTVPFYHSPETHHN